jgi:hypothetical protein
MIFLTANSCSAQLVLNDQLGRYKLFYIQRVDHFC